jgi:hypothetical protein
MPDHRDEFAVTACFDPQNAETVLLIVVRDTLDEAPNTSKLDGSGCGFMTIVASPVVPLRAPNLWLFVRSELPIARCIRFLEAE